MPSLHIEFTDETEPFMNAIYSICAMHVKKAKDYGSAVNPYHNIEACEELGIPAWVGITMRINDKEIRIKNFLQKGELANESVRDSIHDNAVYAILRLMEYDRIQPNHDPTKPLTYPELHHFTNGTSGVCADCGLIWEAYAQAHREGRCIPGTMCYTHGMGEAHTPLRHNSMGDAPSD